MNRLLAALILFPTLAWGDAQSDTTNRDIPRFLKVDEGLYRGGQPVSEGFEFLKQKGIKTVINLRTEDKEGDIVRGLGMKYVHIPVRIHVWSKIPDEAIAKFFETVRDPANQPVFVHCRRGADRTGAMIGFYRISMQGWNGNDAYSEARKIGMRWWYPNVKGQIRNFKATPTRDSCSLKGLHIGAASSRNSLMNFPGVGSRSGF
jgi:protein tyrosine/serine phosphatase